jgi:iron complex outermembrane receptor protein
VQARRDVFGDPLAEVSSVGSQTYGQIVESGANAQLRDGAVRLDISTRLRHERFESGQLIQPRISLLSGAELTAQLGQAQLHAGFATELITHSHALTEASSPRVPLATLLLASPRLGARYRLNTWLSLRGSVAQLQRAPTLIELFGIGEFIRANSALKPESSASAELGLTAQQRMGTTSVRAELTGYVRRAEQLISLTRTSALALRAQNLRDATIVGAEAQLRIQWRQYVTVTASYAWTRATLDGSVVSEATRVPNIAEHDAYVRVDGAWRWLTASVNVSSLAGLFFDTANLSAAPPRTIAGASVSISPPLSQKLVVELSAQNIFDVREGVVRANPQAISDFVGYPLPSRSVVISMQTEL